MKKIEAFELKDVVLTDDWLLNAEALEKEYLLSLDNERWLSGFRENAGLDTFGAMRYPGWEDSLIGGHAFGHWLSACAMMYDNPVTDREEKAALRKKIEYITDELKKCSDASKGKPGFLFSATLLDQNRPELQFDNVEQGKTDIFREAWVPWYTMHKILQGLIDVYRFMRNSAALELADSLGMWVYRRVTAWDDETRERTLRTEYGGMNDCLYQLYEITGKEEFAIAAHVFDEEALFEKVLSGDKDVLSGIHANTTIPKFIGALRRYMACNGHTIGGQKIDASDHLKYAESFFKMVLEKHTYITGGNSENEHFGPDRVLDKRRTNKNNETCNVHNMMKLASMLFMITGDVKYADFFENAYINSILASQNPVTGMTTYFQPMATGYFKVFSSRYENFWCCTGTGMENFSKLNYGIYYKKDNCIWTNMYFSSEVTYLDIGLTLIQDSSVLYGGNSSIELVCDEEVVHAVLAFRIPDWAAGKMEIAIDGCEADYVIKNGYAEIERDWISGSVINITIPMEVKAYVLPDDPSVAGFKYGPVVLSADLGNKEMTETVTGVQVSVPEKKICACEEIGLPEGISKEEFLNDIKSWMIETGDMEFMIEGCDPVFTPHYKKYNTRYGIYWKLV
ncbi:MAG: glycoside hydrolase family 127 protein [Lachnospiraceae bacterium]|nr:glycoside hydrolase family 127 protein [Lachnospiraceae bacterium]